MLIVDLMYRIVVVVVVVVVVVAVVVVPVVAAVVVPVVAAVVVVVVVAVVVAVVVVVVVVVDVVAAAAALEVFGRRGFLAAQRVQVEGSKSAEQEGREAASCPRARGEVRNHNSETSHKVRLIRTFGSFFWMLRTKASKAPFEPPAFGGAPSAVESRCSPS